MVGYIGKEYCCRDRSLSFKVLASAKEDAEHIRRPCKILEEILQYGSGKRDGRKVYGYGKGIFMSLGKSINTIKDKANDIDLNVLFENPEAYYNDIVELLHLIRKIEEPTRINFKDLKNRIFQA